jgi:hypothetical protein
MVISWRSFILRFGPFPAGRNEDIIKQEQRQKGKTDLEIPLKEIIGAEADDPQNEDDLNNGGSPGHEIRFLGVMAYGSDGIMVLEAVLQYAGCKRYLSKSFDIFFLIIID